MVVIFKKGTPREYIELVSDEIRNRYGLNVKENEGEGLYVLAIIGDETKVDFEHLKTLDGVLDAHPIVKPYKVITHEYAKITNNIYPLKIGNIAFNSGYPIFIAGPCAVESEEQLMRIAKQVKEAGAHMLRGGAYKPRTGPYSFEGIGEEGLKILRKASDKYKLPIVTEITDSSDIQLFQEYRIDIYQIGTRNAQNFRLIKEVAKTGKPILLKRGMGNDIKEFLCAAEHIAANGNKKIILCERGLIPFGESKEYQRYVMDLVSISAIKRESYLPVIADPSHGTGRNYLIAPASYAAIAAGADGLIIDVHDRPKEALCDGPQAISPTELKEIIQTSNQLYKIVRKIK